MASFQRAKRKSAFRSRCVRRSPVSQRTASRAREAVVHFSSDSRQKAASELHSSRLVTPHPQPKEIQRSQRFSGSRGTPFRASEAHRLPKSGRYVSTGWGEVKAQKAEISRFSAFRRAWAELALIRVRESVGRAQCADLEADPSSISADRRRARPPVSPAAPPLAAPSCSRRLCFAPAPGADRLRRPVLLATRRSDRNCAGSRADARWR
jgi:hypothetical protein